MSYRESDIVHENPKAWVLDDRRRGAYAVYVIGLTHSVCDSAYPRNEDGLSIAKARADYFQKRSLETA